MKKAAVLGLLIVCTLVLPALAQQPPVPAEAAPLVPPVATPTPAPNGAEPLPPAVANAPAVPPETTTDKEGLTENGWHGSLMFPVSELRRFTEALEAYARRMRSKTKEGENYDNLPVPETIPNPLDQQAGPPKIEAKAFFLSSVAYLNDKEWTVWINGQVYTLAVPPTDFEIVSVKERQVTLRWKVTPEEIETVFPHWREKVTVVEDETKIVAPAAPAQADKKEKTLMASGVVIYYVKSGQFLQFTLHSNQTFVSRGMEIVEGKVESSVVTPAEPGAAEVPAEGAAPGDPAAPEASKDGAPAGTPDANAAATGQAAGTQGAATGTDASGKAVPGKGIPGKGLPGKGVPGKNTPVTSGPAVSMERGASDKLIDMYKKVTPSSPTHRP